MRPPAARRGVDAGLIAQHLAAAIASHRKALRNAGRTEPTGLAELGTLLLGWARAAYPSSPGVTVPVLPRMVYSIDEVAETLGVSASTVKRLYQSGELPSVLISGSRRIRATDLEDYVAGLSGSPEIKRGQERPAA